MFRIPDVDGAGYIYGYKPQPSAWRIAPRLVCQTK